MPIKNYTTKVDLFTSLGEIQSVLARNGASKVMIEYDAGFPVSVSFVLVGPGGMHGFTLPAPVESTLRVFARQKIKADMAQARNTAWRNVRDWTLAQMALVESCDVPVEQVFLPYLTDRSGRTLYAAYVDGTLRLNSGQGDRTDENG